MGLKKDFTSRSGKHKPNARHTKPQRAERVLQGRLEDYTKTITTRRDGGIGFHRPGSNKK